ncbi:hypothetical protein BC833DRAFT_577669 [Globomyces pollinis-pini]|nr:hypothetical protein BC833DRAFT_577669 [Globomyces pollinis-pini]
MILLSKDLFHYGVPVHRLEYLLESVGESIGLPCSFFTLPNFIMMSIQYQNDHKTYLLKQGQNFHMGKLSMVNDLCHELLNGRKTIEDSIVDLKQIREKSSLNKWSFMFLYPATSWLLCLIGFNGTWMDALLSFTMGIIVGAFQILAIDFPTTFGYLFEFLSALVVAVFTNAAYILYSNYGYCIQTQKIMLSALVILLPGLFLTLSIVEISTRNVVCGTVRLASSLFTALLLGFGLAFGDYLVVTKAPSTCPNQSAIPWPYMVVLVPLAGFLICILFEARRSQWLVMVVVSSMGFLTNTALNNSGIFGNNAGASSAIATFVIGIASNIYARFTRDVSIAPILCGILMLVPGSIGVKSTLEFFGNESQGEHLASAMLQISLSITVGLFLATLLVWPIKGRGPSSTKYMIY